MNNFKVIKVGFFGLGTVGGELLNILRTNIDAIQKNYGIVIEIGRIYVRDTTKARSVDTTGLQLTTIPSDVYDDPSVDVICECMGGSGTDETYRMLRAAIDNGKSVVMSSKKVLALYAKDMLELIQSKKVQLRYDATIGGGIPVAKIIRECFKGEKIEESIGILNATSNFIYTRMEKDGLSFEDALKTAQKLGYAENDPSEDINGFDALYKTVVLAIFAMKKWLDIKSMKTTPFSNIDILDMKYAYEMGYKIKPLAILKNTKSGIIYKVGPCLIRENHISANTFDNNNIVVLKGSNSGSFGFYGQGAGSKPTASAMYDDLVNLIQSLDEDHDRHIEEVLTGLAEKIEIHEYRNNLYWRIGLENIVGRLAAICNILTSCSVNIEKIIQKEKINGKTGVVLFTSSADAETINTIIERFEENGVEINAIIPFLGE